MDDRSDRPALSGLGDLVTPERRRGRGAASNPPNRYDRTRTEAADDGWHQADDLAPLRTAVLTDHSRTILTRNASPDIPFDRSVNPYRGCEHGCVYCYARPGHAQLGLSPGLDFETRITIKPRAPALLAEALRRPGYTVAPIALGTMTDPYQPLEREHRIMRGVLEVLWEHRHPVWITTRGAALMDDIDLIGRMGRAGLAQVMISLTTLDPRLSRALEPRATAPGRRIAMIRALADQGVPVMVNTAPIIPALNEPEIERLLQAAAAAGATQASYTVLRLPLEVAPLFRDWLAREYPDRADRVMNKVREMHGGRDYDARWGHRMRGEGVHASLIARRFDVACRRLGLTRTRPALRCDLFRVPPRPGDQLAFAL
jgi:DNA repair photolyase